MSGLPGCKGDCHQGRRPCLHPEECFPDEPFFTQKVMAIIALITLAVWFGVFMLGVMFAWWMTK